MNPDWKTRQFFRMWPRALFHMKQGKAVLEENLNKPGVYILYRDDVPYYIGKTKKLSSSVSAAMHSSPTHAGITFGTTFPRLRFQIHLTEMK